MKISSSYIILKDVHIYARHGVLQQERLTGGEFIVNLKVKYPLQKAIESDNVDDTINYAKLLEIINKEMQKPSCLLEHVAGRIGKSIEEMFPTVEGIDLIITKVNPPMGGHTGGAAVELHLINDKTI
ncbi:MAG: dihydroneopterin aldolase [Prevotellaceae bacterium]|nr:dihydroneopterin aldolase [Prevotellaceae bacterium]